MATYTAKFLATFPVDDYDSFDASLVLKKGMPVLAWKAESEEEDAEKELFLIIGDGVNTFEDLPMYCLSKSDVDLTNYIQKDDVIVGDPVDAAGLKTIVDDLASA